MLRNRTFKKEQKKKKKKNIKLWEKKFKKQL